MLRLSYRLLAGLVSLHLLALVATAAAQQVGDESPDFTLIDSDGGLISLSDFRGAPVMLNFWASWCPPCMAELPLFQTIADDVEADGGDLVILLVNNDQATERERGFLEELGIELPAAFHGTREERARAEEAVDGTLDVMRRFRVRAMPTTMFIDADGVIRAVKLGELLPQEAGSFLAAIGVEWQP